MPRYELDGCVQDHLAAAAVNANFVNSRGVQTDVEGRVESLFANLEVRRRTNAIGSLFVSAGTNRRDKRSRFGSR
jgi:hypothetical protein